jgi:hypothetical protein
MNEHEEKGEVSYTLILNIYIERSCNKAYN